MVLTILYTLTVTTVCSAVNFCKRFENVDNFSVSTSCGGFSVFAGNFRSANKVWSFDSSTGADWSLTFLFCSELFLLTRNYLMKLISISFEDMEQS